VVAELQRSLVELHKVLNSVTVLVAALGEHLDE
jgi:hypothetical protein